MPASLLHPDEKVRLAALARYQILDSEAEAAFDDLVKLAAYICATPVALISFLDAERQWFKSRLGVELTETGRDIAVCNYTVQQESLVVHDLATDPRFAHFPYVREAPHCRFYAGVTLYSEDNQAIGTLCVMDTEQRELTPAQMAALRSLGHQVMSQLELRRRVAQLTRLGQVKTKLLATLSHDIKSPFSGVLGFAEILRDEAETLTTEELRVFADNIHASSRQILFLLDNVLQWTRLELEHLGVRPGKLNLRKTAEDVITLVQGALLRKRQQLQVIIPADYCVQADLNMLTSILLNLLNNAIKFTPEKGSITLQAQEQDTQFVVTVQDTGIGIAPALLAGLFSREQRLAVPVTAKGRGTGLGLLLCKEFIERQEGRIWAESTPGVGSTFHFTLPKGA